VTVAKAYRLLKAIFNTAVDDGLIRRNPCRIPERLVPLLTRCCLRGPNCRPGIHH
jgi:hypothetical protein